MTDDLSRYLSNSPDVALDDADAAPQRPALTPERGAEEPGRVAWDAFRDKHLTPNGWHYETPGIYVHAETGQEYHPHDQFVVGGNVYTRWRLHADLDMTPDPHTSHLDRRKVDYERARALEARE